MRRSSDIYKLKGLVSMSNFKSIANMDNIYIFCSNFSTVLYNFN